MNLDNNESLKRLLLNMKYDSKKTLSENLDRIILNEGTTSKAYTLQMRTNNSLSMARQTFTIPKGLPITKRGRVIEIGNAKSENFYGYGCDTKNFGYMGSFSGSQGAAYENNELAKLLDDEYCKEPVVFDSSTHWVKDEKAWKTLLEKLQWMSNTYFGGGKINIQPNWVSIDQVKFHKLKSLGTFAAANCGVTANPTSGGQYNGEDFFDFKLNDKNDGGVNIPIATYVTKYLRCTEGSKKDEKVVDKTKSDVKTTQTPPKKTTVQSGWNETCQGTYSMGCKTPEVGRVQQCLKDQGLYPYTVDDKFGKRTRTAVYNKLGKSSFTDADIETICKTTSGGGGEPQDDFDSDMGRRTGEEQEIDDKTWTGDVY